MLLLYAVGIALAGVVALSVLRAVASPLRAVPGPFLARFTRLWYLRRVALGRFDADNRALHRRYGSVVRVAPNMYSLAIGPPGADNDDVMAKVYSVGAKMPKSAWYEGWKHPSPERWSLFTDRSLRRHAETRRRFQALYSMTSLVSYEGYVDGCTALLLARLDEFAAAAASTTGGEQGEEIDMMHWLQCYAFDVIGDITYSARFGFLDKGEDVQGLIAALQSTMLYSTLVGIVPEMHPVLYKILERFGVGGAAGRSYLMKFVTKRIAQRRAEREVEAAAGKKDAVAASQDSNDDGIPKAQSFLDKLLDQNEKDPDKITDYHVFMVGFSNIGAGSDTTAITLSAIMYHLLRNPSALAALRKEVDGMAARGKMDDKGVLRFADAKDMVYLQAVIKEAMRLHAATGLPLWRDVVEGGAVLGGQFFPEGTTVGVNTWCAHYSESLFGEDASEFRPERWLEGEGRVKEMNAYYLPFGSGSRTCIGRHISMLEMTKLIPLLVNRYDFELVNGQREWNTLNLWFVKPVDFKVRVRRRISQGPVLHEID